MDRSKILEKVAAKAEDYPAIKHFIGDAGKKELERKQARRFERAARKGDSLSSRIGQAKNAIKGSAKARGTAAAEKFEAAKASIKSDITNPKLSKNKIVDRAKSKAGKVRVNSGAVQAGKVGRKYISKVDKAVGKTFKYGAGVAALGGAAALANKARKRKEK